MFLHNLRQRLDHMLDPLPRPDKAEGQQHSLPLHAELLLESRRFHELHIRDPVRDEINFFLGHAIGLRKDLHALVSHHHQSIAQGDQPLHHLHLRGIGIL